MKEHASAVATRKTTRRQFGAAALAVAAGGLGLYYAARPHADYETATAERRNIRLPDGSSAELAAQTRIALGFDDRFRRVRLLDGEVFFDVAAVSDRPFLVEAHGATIAALGTAFAVSSYSSTVRVVVTHHAVRLSAMGSATRIDAGQRALFDGRAIGPLEAADSTIDLAWRDGRLVFTHAPFGEVAATINRWRRGRLIVVGEELSRRPVTVIAEIARIDEVIERLGEILPVRLVGITPWLTLAIPA
jgi:transmembrane sensor